MFVQVTKRLLSSAVLALTGFCFGAWVLTIFPSTAQTKTPGPARAATGETSARIWKSEQPQELNTAAHDGDLTTYVVLTPDNRDSEVRVGFEWAAPRRLNGLRVMFACLNGAAYEPLSGFQSLEYRDGQEWKLLRAELIIDYQRAGEFAAFQKSGLVIWDYRFPPLDAAGIRLRLARTASSIRWEQRYVIRELEPYLADGERHQTGRIVVIGDPQHPESLQRLSHQAAGSQVKRSPDAKGTVLSWLRPQMMSELKLPLEDLPGPLQWWDGQSWRSIEIERVEKHPAGFPRITVSFLPIAIQRLRIVGLFDSGPLEVQAERAPQYFDRVYQSGRDLLMDRLLKSPEEPDLASVASLLLPLDMQTSVIGRPGDKVECMVHWNGTIVEVENGDQGAWNHGAKETVPGKEKWIDRWFAFAVEGELFGTDMRRTSRSYLDGFMPAVITRYSSSGLNFEEEVFTTAPDDSVYGQVVSVKASNPDDKVRKTRLSLVLGRRRSAVAGHRSASPGETSSPMSFEPLDTGYQFEPDHQTIRNSSGEVVLYAQLPFRQGGSSLEPILDYSVELAPKGSKEFRFVLPSVNSPVKERAALVRFDAHEGKARFQRYWDQLLQGRTRLELPEPPVDDLYKNLLAQAMIVLGDGDQLKYGAYWYEWYFGVEEGWPVAALAQFGHAELAKRSIRLMLSPQLTDKSNYHHQYRNGLAPMYAAQVYRLTRDRAWLRQISSDLKVSVDWIFQARHQVEGKSPEYQGLLPRHAYGGDVHTPAYSIYSNATCWRGLQDTAYLLKELGETQLAEKYSTDAAEYRRRIEQVVSKFANQDVHPPFVPLALDIGVPETPGYRSVETPYSFIPSDPLGNYWILMAPLMLETGVFPADSRYAKWITDFMEQRGGLLAGLARFYRGVDHIYGFAYPLQLYDRGERKKFLASVYSILAHGSSRDNFTSPEVAGVFPLRTDNLAWQETFRRSLWNWDLYGSGWMQEEFGKAIGAEPLSAGSGMALQLVRKMVFNEKLDPDGNPTGELDLLEMAPSRWLENEKKIVLSRMPTIFGEISLDLRSQITQGKVAGRFEAPDQPAAKIRLWLRHPRGLPIKSVKFNRTPVRDFRAEFLLLPTKGVTEFEVEF